MEAAPAFLSGHGKIQQDDPDSFHRNGFSYWRAQDVADHLAFRRVGRECAVGPGSRRGPVRVSLFGHITGVRKLRVVVQLVTVSIGLVNNLTAQDRARGRPKAAWMRLEGPGEVGLGTSLYDVGSRQAKANMRRSSCCSRCGAAIGLFVLVRNVSVTVYRAPAAGRYPADARRSQAGDRHASDRPSAPVRRSNR